MHDHDQKLRDMTRSVLPSTARPEAPPELGDVDLLPFDDLAECLADVGTSSAPHECRRFQEVRHGGTVRAGALGPQRIVETNANRQT